jgi:hypothetical protein
MVGKLGQAGARAGAHLNAPSRRDAEMARLIFDALKRANTDALILGNPDDVLIDGTFDLVKIARWVRVRLEKLDQP